MKDNKWYYLSNNDYPQTSMDEFEIAYLDQQNVRRITTGFYNMTGGFFTNYLGKFQVSARNITYREVYAWREMVAAPEYK